MVECQDPQLDDLYQALSNPARRHIVSLLAVNPRNISELVPEFAMSLAAVSKHVKVLERAGIVSCAREGRKHVCSLQPDALGKAYAWLQAYERFWQDRLAAFDRVLAEEAAHDQD